MVNAMIELITFMTNRIVSKILTNTLSYYQCSVIHWLVLCTTKLPHSNHFNYNHINMHVNIIIYIYYNYLLLIFIMNQSMIITLNVHDHHHHHHFIWFDIEFNNACHAIHNQYKHFFSSLFFAKKKLFSFVGFFPKFLAPH